MNIAVVMLVSLALLLVGYRLYSAYLVRVVGVDPTRTTPAVSAHDGVDFVPTKPLVLFGHHFAAIAAAGPIVGPTLALYFGFAPAWLWIVLGVIFIGAVHDFLALFVAVREGGHSVAEVARKTLGKPGFVFYVSFAILLCLLVVAAFLQLTALALTSSLPPDDVQVSVASTGLHFVEAAGGLRVQIGGVASMSVVVMTVLAPLVGYLIYRRHAHVGWVTLLALGLSFGSIVVGYYFPITIDAQIWIWLIIAYVFVASWVPVWIILQPRDFVNAQILYVGVASMVIGILGAGIKGVGINIPAFNLGEAMSAPNLGPIWPFLFITIACGAASGAHGLVCGGTTCKQLASEGHARPVGYGGMLLEGVLAVSVILLIAGGLDFDKYKSLVYPVSGGSNAPLAFALALGSILHTSVGLPVVMGTIWGILLLEGFLVTTIDALVRLSRYLLEELWVTVLPHPPALLRNRIVNSLLVVTGALGLTLSNAYLKIWPIFGAANQLLAALTLIAVSAWLAQKAKSYWFAAIPAAFMIVTTVTALMFLLGRYARMGSIALVATDVLLLVLAGGVVVMTFRYFYGLRARLVRAATEPG